jgi:hypothetical protein
MSVVRRRRDAIDALEHALQGVKTYEDHEIVSHEWDPGIIGKRSAVEINVRDAEPDDREVVVTMPPVRRRRRSR